MSKFHVSLNDKSHDLPRDVTWLSMSYKEMTYIYIGPYDGDSHIYVGMRFRTVFIPYSVFLKFLSNQSLLLLCPCFSISFRPCSPIRSLFGSLPLILFLSFFLSVCLSVCLSVSLSLSLSLSLWLSVCLSLALYLFLPNLLRSIFWFSFCFSLSLTLYFMVSILI